MSVAIPTFDTPHARTRLAITVACTSLGFFVVQLDGSILNIALSQIGISLRTGIGDLQWTVDAYFLTFAVLLLSAGSLSDRWGARRAFVSGFVVFSAASLSCGVAPNATALIAARAMQGAGAALLVPCSLTLLNDACGSDVGARARAVGLWTAAGGVGMAAGPVLGGLLVGAFGWRSIFFVNLPLGLAGIWLTLRFLDQHEPPQRRRSLDLAGQALAALTLLGFVGAIIEAGSLGWHTRLVLYGAISTVTAGVAFIVVEAKAADPALPRELFQSTILRTAVLIGFSANLVIFGISFAFALYFQRVLSFTTVETGLAFLPFALMITAANVVGGRFVARCGLRIPIVMGLVIAAAGRPPVRDQRPYALSGNPSGPADHQDRHRFGGPRDDDRRVVRCSGCPIRRRFRGTQRGAADGWCCGRCAVRRVDGDRHGAGLADRPRHLRSAPSCDGHNQLRGCPSSARPEHRVSSVDLGRPIPVEFCSSPVGSSECPMTGLSFGGLSCTSIGLERNSYETNSHPSNRTSPPPRLERERSRSAGTHDGRSGGRALYRRHATPKQRLAHHGDVCWPLGLARIWLLGRRAQIRRCVPRPRWALATGTLAGHGVSLDARSSALGKWLRRRGGQSGSRLWFSNHPVPRLVSLIDPQNAPSQRVASRLGETKGGSITVELFDHTFSPDVWEISRDRQAA